MMLPDRYEMIRQIHSPEIDAFVDPKAQFDRAPIESTTGFVGNCILLQACGGCCRGSTCLVKVKEIAFVESPEGFRFLARLAGDVVWGDVPWKTVNIDRRKYYSGRGWTEEQGLENFALGFPHSRYQTVIRKTVYHVLHANGFNLVAQTTLDAIDLITDAEICWQKDTTKGPSCARIVNARCTPFICWEPCEVIQDGSELGDCNCPDSFLDNPLGSCMWLDWARCVTINCPPRQKCWHSLFRCTCS